MDKTHGRKYWHFIWFSFLIFVLHLNLFFPLPSLPIHPLESSASVFLFCFLFICVSSIAYIIHLHQPAHANCFAFDSPVATLLSILVLHIPCYITPLHYMIYTGCHLSAYPSLSYSRPQLKSPINGLFLFFFLAV
ncbi:hypothetical protein BJX70DRAFT_228505 [Aspergillus crustosus]